jgi:hypothetical protein
MPQTKLHCNSPGSLNLNDQVFGDDSRAWLACERQMASGNGAAAIVFMGG